MKSIEQWQGDARLTVITFEPAKRDEPVAAARLGLQKDVRTNGIDWEHVVVDDSGLLVIRRQELLATNKVSNRPLVGTLFKALTLHPSVRWATDPALMRLGVCSDSKRLEYGLRGKRSFTFSSEEATSPPHVCV